MKLLVLAQVPPPTHGQSLAVAGLLDHLRAQPDFEVHHVNLGLSHDADDVGRWRPGKVVATVRAAGEARRLCGKHGPMPLYYVPAPAKRGALYRDWAIFSMLRRHVSGVILHWHAVGLGEWLATQATTFERVLTHRLLGRATLSIAQSPSCAPDAGKLHPQRCIVVRNGVPDPSPGLASKDAASEPLEVLFVGLGCASKGLFDALEAVRLANQREPGACRFSAIGPFASDADAAEFRRRAAPLGAAAQHHGFVGPEQKHALFRRADVFCFPSYYPHEGQPAVLLEALAHDLPIVTTRWRGIADDLEVPHVHFAPPKTPLAIAEALLRVRSEGPPRGALRTLYLARFTRERHLHEVTAALRSVGAALPR